MTYEPRLTDFQPPQHMPSESLTGLPASPPVLATDHFARALETDPATAAFAHATSDALHAATRARQVLHRNTLQYAARLLREAFPDAAAITADTSDGELYEVRDADGRALYRAPFTPASSLDDRTADDVTDLLKQTFLFGGLDEAGWQTAAEGEPYRSIALPTVDMARRSTTASSFPTPEGMATIMAEYTPGATPAFQITGLNSTFARETRDRIRAAIVNSGFEWEPGLMQIVAHWTVVRTGSSSDLALACTALAAAGVIDPATLNGVAMIGELGLDGRVRSVRDVTDTVRTAQEAGYRKFIVARDDFDEVSENIDITPVGANDLTAALAFLFDMHETETTNPAPEVPTQGTPGEDAGHCAQCSKLLIWDRSGKRLNDEWGEYICTGTRQPGRSSSVHLLAK